MMVESTPEGQEQLYRITSRIVGSHIGVFVDAAFRGPTLPVTTAIRVGMAERLVDENNERIRQSNP